MTKTKKAKPAPAVNKGANLMKSRTIAYLERLLKRLQAEYGEGSTQTLGTTLTLRWLRTADERAAKRPGGIGRK